VEGAGGEELFKEGAGGVGGIEDGAAGVFQFAGSGDFGGGAGLDSLKLESHRFLS
jgi:hypothetical protein